MISEIRTLKDLPIGKTATITAVGGEGALRQHFLDMGVIPEADVTMVKYAPMGDPVELRIHGYSLTLRLADAERISITDVRDNVEKEHEEIKASNSLHIIITFLSDDS
jgi:ferrous iron transport protein B